MITFNRHALLTMGFLVASAQVQAAELSFKYDIKASAESDSNVRLTTNKTKIQGGVLSANFELASKTPTLELGLVGGADFSKFDESRFDSNDQDIAAHANYKTAQSELGITAGFMRDSTRTSELEDTGRFQDAAIRREQGDVGVHWNYTINRTNGVKLSAQHSEVDYATDLLRDYDVENVTLTYTHILNKRISLQAQAYLQNYQTSGGLEIAADTFGGQVGVVTALSKKFSFTALVGTAKTDQDFDTPFGTVSQSSNNFVLNASLKYRVPRYEMSLGLTRSITPSGNGFVQLSTIGRANVSYRVGKYAQIFANITQGTNKTVGNTFSANRDFQSASAGLRYRISKAWRLSLRYRYRNQEPFNSNIKAKSNAVYFTLHYQPLAHKWKS